MAHSGHICISDIFEWSEGLPNDTNDRSHADTGKVSPQERLGGFLNSVYRAKTKIPILVVSNDVEQVTQMVEMLYTHFPKEIANHQLFFSLVPPPELLSQLQLLSSWTRVFTLTSQLPDIPPSNVSIAKMKVHRVIVHTVHSLLLNSFSFYRNASPLTEVKSLQRVTCGESGSPTCPFAPCFPFPLL